MSRIFMRGGFAFSSSMMCMPTPATFPSPGSIFRLLACDLGHANEASAGIDMTTGNIYISTYPSMWIELLLVSAAGVAGTSFLVSASVVFSSVFFRSFMISACQGRNSHCCVSRDYT